MGQDQVKFALGSFSEEELLLSALYLAVYALLASAHIISEMGIDSTFAQVTDIQVEMDPNLGQYTDIQLQVTDNPDIIDSEDWGYNDYFPPLPDTLSDVSSVEYIPMEELINTMCLCEDHMTNLLCLHDECMHFNEAKYDDNIRCCECLELGAEVKCHSGCDKYFHVDCALDGYYSRSTSPSIGLPAPAAPAPAPAPAPLASYLLVLILSLRLLYLLYKLIFGF